MRILTPALTLLLCCVGFLQAETLTPLGNGETAPQTTAELWAEFDPTVEALDSEILYSWEEDGVTMRVVRYRVGVFKGEDAFVAGIYGFPTGQTNLPALLHIHGGGQFADYRTCLTNGKRGYATLSLAWAGRINAASPNDAGVGYYVSGDDLQVIFDGSDFDNDIEVTTDWGALEGYHAPSRFTGSSNVVDLNPQSYTYDDVESPRNSTWFYWAMAARRGLTYLQAQPEVDGSKLGVYGHSMGGKLTVMTTGTDSRVKAAAPSCGGVSDFEKFAYYDATIGDPGHLAGIQAPIFFLKPSNDFHSHIADVPAAVATVEGNGQDWRVTTSAHANHSDTAEYTVATQLWMDWKLKGGTPVPDTPDVQLVLDNHSGVPSVTITADNDPRTIKSVEVFYTQAGEDAAEVHHFTEFVYRHWQYAAPQGSGANWTADLPIHDTNEPLWVFVNVTYDLDAPITGAGYGYNIYTANDFVISSPILSATSAELQTAGVNATIPATTLIEDFQGDWKKEWLTDYNETLPWRATSHKFNDPIYVAPQYAKLALEVRSLQANTLVLRISDGINTGYAQVPLPASTEMQEIELQPSDFKIAAEPWDYDWDDALELELMAWAWNGDDPEFQNLRWEAGTRTEYDAQFTNELLLLTPDEGKYYLTLDTAQEKTELIASVEGTWFGGGALDIGGTVYTEGLTVHAPGELVYFLGSAFDRFEVIAAVSSVLDVPVQMKVYLDDVLAYDSGDQGNGDYDVVSLDVSGVSIMRLVTSYSGGTSNGAHSSWVDAHLTLPAEPSPGDGAIFYEDFEGIGGNLNVDSTDGDDSNGDADDGWTNYFVDGATKLSISSPVPFSGQVAGGSGTWFGNLNAWYFLPTALDPADVSGYTSKPYIGSSDPVGLGNHYMEIGGFDGAAWNTGWGYQVDTSTTVVEGTEYELSFNYFKMPNTFVNTGNLDVLAMIVDFDQIDGFGAIAAEHILATQTFPAATTVSDIKSATLSYTGTASDAGKTLGLIIRNVDSDVVNKAGLDNLLFKTVVNEAPVTGSEMSSTTELEYAGDVSGSDLLHGKTAVGSGWVLGLGLLNDGAHGLSFADAGNTVQGAWTAVGATAEFNLGTGSNGSGYDITSIQSIATWTGGGFRNQAWTVEVKPVGGSWTTLDTVDYQPFTDADVGAGATKVILADESGVLATGIQYIRFTANSVGGATNSGAFIWRELDVFGTNSPPETVPPTMVKFTPDTVVDGTIRSNVSTSTLLVAKFNEDIQIGSGDITILNLDTLAETVISLPDSQVSVDPIDASILMIEPSTALLANTRYAVCIDSTVVDDLSGNNFAGVLDTTTWTFTTRAEEPLEILCIGDSITVGYTATGFDTFDLGYRGHLYNLLNDAGYVFQFVGESEQPWVNPFGIDPTDGGTYRPVFEQDLRFHDQDYHQGGEGASIGAIANWFQNPDVDPDLVLLKIGINSIQDGVLFSTVRDNIYSLVDAIMTQKPDAHVIVAQIIPYSGDYTSWPVNVGKNDVLYQYNVYIRDTLSVDLANAGHDVSNYSTVDLYSMFLTDTNDYTSAVALNRHSNNYNHPWNVAVDGAGYDTMAQQWFDAIEALNIGPGSFGFWLSDPAMGIDPAEQGFDDDPDGDGLASGLEAWLGTNPGAFDFVAMTNLGTNGLVTSFQHPQGTNIPSDVQGNYEWSINLSDWYAGDGADGPVSGETVTIAPVTVTGMTTVTATSNEAMDSIFLRANVTQQN